MIFAMHAYDVYSYVLTYSYTRAVGSAWVLEMVINITMSIHSMVFKKKSVEWDLSEVKMMNVESIVQHCLAKLH